MLNDDSLLDIELQVDWEMKRRLKDSAAWARFLGICGFIYAALVAIGSMSIGLFMSRIMGNATGSGVVGVMVAVFYLVVAVIIFLLSLFLYRFAVNTKLALETNDQQQLVMAFKNLNTYFKIAGIITVISVGLTVLAMFGMVMSKL